MLARARREPELLVIGIDAAAVPMAESSLRAARSARRGGLPNPLFVVAAAEHLPCELNGIAAEVSVLFPWGSLLRATLALDDDAPPTNPVPGGDRLDRRWNPDRVLTTCC